MTPLITGIYTPWPYNSYHKITMQGYASYQVMREDRFVRIELIEMEGRKAWSSPFAVNYGL